MNMLRTSCVVATAALMGVAVSAAWADSNSSNSQNARQQGQLQSAQDEQSQQYDRQNAQDEQSEQNARRISQNQEDQQFSQNENQRRLNGVVQVYREVNVDGTNRFRARLSTPSGKVETVDLGPSDQNQDLIDNLEQGDRISVQGQEQRMDGKRIFAATRARVGGQSYRIDQDENSNFEQAEQAQGRDWRENNWRERNENEQAESQRNQQHPRAVVLVNERYVFVDEGDLNRHLILAKENLRMGDTQSAAGELRVAAQRLDLYGKSAQGKSAHEFTEAKQELDRLADQISKGGQNMLPQEIDRAAARAQIALAQYFDQQAQNAKGNNQAIEAGYALQSAATHAKQALMWSDERIDPNSARSIHQAMQTADALISGNHQQGQNVAQVAQNLSQQISRIDQQIEQNQAQPASGHQQGNQHQNRSQQENSGANANE